VSALFSPCSYFRWNLRSNAEVIIKMKAAEFVTSGRGGRRPRVRSVLPLPHSTSVDTGAGVAETVGCRRVLARWSSGRGESNLRTQTTKMKSRQLAAVQLALVMGVVATAASTGSSSCFALPATATDAGAFGAHENVRL
jgi:hypothetical protein